MKFFVLLRICNCKTKELLHEKVKIYRRQDTGNLSPKKQIRVHVFFALKFEISKKF